MFLNTNIRVWVLTGDKQETAIEIARSCNLIQLGFKEITLNIPSKTLTNESINHLLH